MSKQWKLEELEAMSVHDRAQLYRNACRLGHTGDGAALKVLIEKSGLPFLEGAKPSLGMSRGRTASDPRMTAGHHNRGAALRPVKSVPLSSGQLTAIPHQSPAVATAVRTSYGDAKANGVAAFSGVFAEDDWEPESDFKPSVNDPSVEIGARQVQAGLTFHRGANDDGSRNSGVGLPSPKDRPLAGAIKVPQTVAQDEPHPSILPLESLPALTPEPKQHLDGKFIGSGRRPWVWIFGTLILITALCLYFVDSRMSDPVGTTQVEKSSAGVDASRNLAARNSFVTRLVNVRAGPSTKARIMGQLRRGTLVSGKTVYGDGRNWLRLEGASYSGGHVYEPNIGDEAPPSLVYSGGTRTAMRFAQVRARPAFDSLKIGEVTTGLSLTVAGETRDGWVEILRRGGQGVGYVRREAFAPEGSESPISEMVPDAAAAPG